MNFFEPTGFFHTVGVKILEKNFSDKEFHEVHVPCWYQLCGMLPS
jgi:hypothetical protein